jgi:hypothetical protein
MPEYAQLLVDECPSASGLRRHRDPLLVALVREHGPPRYDYPPKLVRYYKLDHVKTNDAQRRRLAAKNHPGTKHEDAGHAPSSAQGMD